MFGEHEQKESIFKYFPLFSGLNSFSKRKVACQFSYWKDWDLSWDLGQSLKLAKPSPGGFLFASVCATHTLHCPFPQESLILCLFRMYIFLLCRKWKDSIKNAFLLCVHLGILSSHGVLQYKQITRRDNSTDGHRQCFLLTLGIATLLLLHENPRQCMRASAVVPVWKTNKILRSLVFEWCNITVKSVGK